MAPGQYAKPTRHYQHTTSCNHSGPVELVSLSVGVQDLLRGVQLAGGKPEVLGFIIAGPLH